MKSVSLKPAARTLSELKKRIRSSTYEINAVPSIKTAVARASRDVRELKQSLNKPSDVTTSKRFQKSLSRTCRVAAEASSSVHDLNILVEVQERKLKEEYERAVRRLDGERAMMMAEVVEPAQRKLHDLRRKIDTYEGLESCPLVEHALRMSSPALREAKRFVTLPASELVKNAIGERGTLSHKRLERILEDVRVVCSRSNKYNAKMKYNTPTHRYRETSRKLRNVWTNSQRQYQTRFLILSREFDEMMSRDTI